MNRPHFPGVLARFIPTALLACLLLAPSLVSAQAPAGMEEMMRRFQDPAAMQRMAQQAQAAQQCMEKIDRAKLDALQRRAEKASQEIDGLCKAGKRDEALRKGLSLYEEMRKDATITQLRACTKDMAAMLEGMPWGDMPGVKDEGNPTRDDICS